MVVDSYWLLLLQLRPNANRYDDEDDDDDTAFFEGSDSALDFLTKYCIITDAKQLARYRVEFDNVDRDSDGIITEVIYCQCNYTRIIIEVVCNWIVMKVAINIDHHI